MNIKGSETGWAQAEWNYREPRAKPKVQVSSGWKYRPQARGRYTSPHNISFLLGRHHSFSQWSAASYKFVTRTNFKGNNYSKQFTMPHPVSAPLDHPLSGLFIPQLFSSRPWLQILTLSPTPKLSLGYTRPSLCFQICVRAAVSLALFSAFCYFLLLWGLPTPAWVLQNLASSPPAPVKLISIYGKGAEVR